MLIYKIIHTILFFMFMSLPFFIVLIRKFPGKVKISIDNLTLDVESNVTGNIILTPKKDIYINKIILNTTGFFQRNNYQREVFFIRKQNIISDLSLKKAEEFNKNFSIKLLEQKDYEDLPINAKKYLNLNNNISNKGGLLSNLKNLLFGPKWQLEIIIYSEGKEFLITKNLKIK